MFVTEEDYRVVIGDTALKVISQVSTENRANASEGSYSPGNTDTPSERQ